MKEVPVMAHDPQQTEQTEQAATRDEAWRDPADGGMDAAAATTKELWRQLVEARQKAGLTQTQVAERMGVSQAQVARIEKRGYEAYTLTTLRRYLEALGNGFHLEVRVTRIGSPTDRQPVAAHG